MALRRRFSSWIAVSGWLITSACSPSRGQLEQLPPRGILYTSQAPNGAENLRLLNPISGASTIVVAGDANSSRSLGAWSPDSRRIAWIQESATNDQLFVRDTLERDATRIGSKLPRAVMFPDWAPDGKRIAVSAGDSASHPGVYVVDVATGGARPIRVDASSYRCPSWSPQGDRFVVAAYANAMSAVLILDTLGAVLDSVVRSDSTYLDCPQWSPKGDEVLFTIFHGGGLSGWDRPAFHSNLAIVSLVQRTTKMVTRDSGLTNYGRWSREGLWIVFQSDRHASPITEESGVAQMMRNLEIWIVRRDGSGLRRLTSNSYFDAHPSW